jgi:uncharacterized membrane protein (Fun14 family)
MELNSDILVNGAIGAGTGYILGWLFKKISGIIFKSILVLGALFLFALIYLQSIKVININERALDNLVTETFNRLNNTIGPEAIQNPATYIFTSIGLPMTSGIAIGFVAGFLRG